MRGHGEAWVCQVVHPAIPPSSISPQCSVAVFARVEGASWIVDFRSGIYDKKLVLLLVVIINTELPELGSFQVPWFELQPLQIPLFPAQGPASRLQQWSPGRERQKAPAGSQRDRVHTLENDPLLDGNAALHLPSSSGVHRTRYSLRSRCQMRLEAVCHQQSGWTEVTTAQD